MKLKIFVTLVALAISCTLFSGNIFLKKKYTHFKKSNKKVAVLKPSSAKKTPIKRKEILKGLNEKKINSSQNVQDPTETFFNEKSFFYSKHNECKQKRLIAGDSLTKDNSSKNPTIDKLRKLSLDSLYRLTNLYYYHTDDFGRNRGNKTDSRKGLYYLAIAVFIEKSEIENNYYSARFEVCMDKWFSSYDHIPDSIKKLTMELKNGGPEGFFKHHKDPNELNKIFATPYHLGSKLEDAGNIEAATSLYFAYLNSYPTYPNKVIAEMIEDFAKRNRLVDLKRRAKQELARIKKIRRKQERGSGERINDIVSGLVFWLFIAIILAGLVLLAFQGTIWLIISLSLFGLSILFLWALGKALGALAPSVM